MQTGDKVIYLVLVIMKQKITVLIIGDELRYIVQNKEHWWNKWRFIMDGCYPRLFRAEELVKFGIVDKSK